MDQFFDNAGFFSNPRKTSHLNQRASTNTSTSGFAVFNNKTIKNFLVVSIVNGRQTDELCCVLNPIKQSHHEKQIAVQSSLFDSFFLTVQGVSGASLKGFQRASRSDRNETRQTPWVSMRGHSFESTNPKCFSIGTKKLGERPTCLLSTKCCFVLSKYWTRRMHNVTTIAKVEFVDGLVCIATKSDATTLSSVRACQTNRLEREFLHFSDRKAPKKRTWNVKQRGPSDATDEWNRRSATCGRR